MLRSRDAGLDVVNMSFYTDPWLYNCASADDYVSGAVTPEQIAEQAFIRETVLAARRVVVTAERIVMRGTIPPERVVVPGAVVDAVAEVPGGARPTSMPGHYDYDRQWMEAHVAASRAGGATFDRYLEEQLARSSGGAS